MASELRIADDLTLPIDAVTETFLIFGKRGSGKTTAASVLTEELLGAGLPVCVIDPMGAWWGLRSSADGQGPGLPVTILGGEHADLPLDPASGTAVADLVASERLPVVLDMFLMSKTQQRKFVTDFMERLFRRNREPLHLVIDEADRFASQGGERDPRLLGAYEDIVLRGRKPGIGSTSITLRPAQLHSAIRSQVEVLIAMRLLGKLDVAAIDEWIRLHASDEDAKELKDSLPSLPVGTAWVWSPGWLEVMRKIQVRPRHTFDSSATPKVGERVIVPRRFAPVDPADLERMAVLLQREEKPAKGEAVAPEIAGMRREITVLRTRLAEATQREPERVEVPVLAPGDIAALEQAVTGLRDIAGSIELALSRATRPQVSEHGHRQVAPARQPAARSEAGAANPGDAAPPLPDARDSRPRPLKAGARSMLEQLARHHPLTMTRNQLAALAGIKGSGSTFTSYFSALRMNGLVNQEGAFVAITPAGLAAAGAAAETPPPTPEEIRARWRSVLKAGARSMLDHLLERYPEPISRADLAELAGINPVGSTLTSYLSTLRSNNLITEDSAGIRAADVFFLAGPTAIDAGERSG
jgi:DNA polymerase III delta prime subunit